ncbi:hypothetical protein LTR62_007007 [Meristemomyces frigidus]|uniref:Pet127-domain-containing protein n=1 Tax=Meristemomyces frigidus TaxID=1508187 RepID=A0AAN7TBP4_9PEZI|nr:hypothetical protein LTR62_007007 [Meristemomyces frigidus]
MYRSAIRAARRNTEACDYICNQSRHTLAPSRRRRVGGAVQTRGESTVTRVAQDTETENWFDNLNSLSEDFPDARRSKRAEATTKPTYRGINARDSHGHPSKTTTISRKPVKAPGTSIGRSLSAQLQKYSRGERAGTTSVRFEVRPPRRSELRSERRRHKAARNELATTVKVASQPMKDEEAVSSNANEQARERNEFEALMARLKAEKLSVEQPFAYSEQTDGPDVHAALDKIELPAQPTFTNDAAGMARKMEPHSRIEAPIFPYPTRPRSVVAEVPASDAALLKATKSMPEKSPEESAQAMQSSTTNTVSDPPPRQYAFSKRSNPFSIAAKVRESQSRPMWGGVSAPATTTTRKTSFDTLRAADAVSVKSKFQTAGQSTAWGKETVQKPSVATPVESSTGQDDAAVGDPIMDNDCNARHGEKTRAEPSSTAASTIRKSIDRVVNSTIHGLKEKFNMRLGDVETSTQVENKVSSPGVVADARAQVMHGSVGIGGRIVAEEGYGGAKVSGSLPNKTFTMRRISGAPMYKQVDLPQVHGKRAQGAIGEHGAVSKRDPPVQRLVVETHTGDDEVAVAEINDNNASSRLAGLHTPAAGESALVTTTGQGRRTSRRTPRVRRVASLEVRSTTSTNDRTSAFIDNAEDHKALAEVMEAAQASDERASVIPEDVPEEESVSTPEPYENLVESTDIRSMSAADLHVTALDIEQPPVPPLAHGLERVLFNPGVYQLQDPHARVFNFDPYLQKIMPINEFDFNALKEYKTSSQDVMLAQIANEHHKKYVGSTSSMTSTLGHFHYLLSNWRPLNLNMLSKGFAEKAENFTLINRAPNAIFLRYKQASGTYAIDADKEYDSPNVLMMLGKSMEKLLTLPKDEFERYRLGNTENPISEAEKDAPEAFQYTTMGDFLMRSQLDSYDPRLPGTGMFDLKTRAVLPIRMDAEGYESMLGYEILTLQGRFESYEREYYDMMRSTMLKYMLQARMGRMDGIFVAYHNIQRLFGFQYLPISEIDRAIHGQVDGCLGDQEFRFGLKLMNEAMEMATQKFPGTSLRLHFECADKPQNLMWIFAEPMGESEIKEIQNKGKDKVAAFEAEVMGLVKGEQPQVDVVSKILEKSSKGQSLQDAMVSGATKTDFSSTTSPADPRFIKKITPPDPSTLTPLFAATLIIQNFVNGIPCDENRPHNLKRGEKWEVQYILKEAPIELSEKWARYEDCKTRRRLTFAKTQSADTTTGGNGDKDDKPAKSDRDRGYFRLLEEMVARGRKFRSLVDKAEEGMEKVVLGEVPAKKDVVENVEGVGGYLQWLYRNKE